MYLFYQRPVKERYRVELNVLDGTGVYYRKDQWVPPMSG
jgi:hypothetical protein